MDLYTGPRARPLPPTNTFYFFASESLTFVGFIELKTSRLLQGSWSIVCGRKIIICDFVPDDAFNDRHNIMKNHYSDIVYIVIITYHVDINQVLNAFNCLPLDE